MTASSKLLLKEIVIICCRNHFSPNHRPSIPTMRMTITQTFSGQIRHLVFMLASTREQNPWPVVEHPPRTWDKSEAKEPLPENSRLSYLLWVQEPEACTATLSSNRSLRIRVADPTICLNFQARNCPCSKILDNSWQSMVILAAKRDLPEVWLAPLTTCRWALLCTTRRDTGICRSPTIAPLSLPFWWVALSPCHNP